jgi:predicted lipoprotein with Yx(FWY)xxD motif
MMTDRRLAVAVCVLLVSACSGLAYAPVRFANGVMTNDAGMTLYTFDKDVAGAGKSVCSDQCAANWPPFAAGAADHAGGDWAIVTRDDGTRQWAWAGKPLYLWSKDQKPGDVTGDGFNNVWHAVKPEPRPLTGSMSGP